MAWAKWWRWQARPVEQGAVVCDLQGRSVEVASCERCPWLIEVDLLSERPSVVCRPDAAELVARTPGVMAAP
jgi:hypothetical protein